jgi:DNA-binding GntR family transcriptional regulator
MQPLVQRPILIDQTYDRLLAAITDGTLPPGRRIRQEELADTLGVSRQPISHALQILKRQGLVTELGKRGLTVAGIDAARIRDLYQIRTAIEALAARLAAARMARGDVAPADRHAVESALAVGAALAPTAAISRCVAADVAFHTSIYRLSGNGAIEETVAAQWPHFMRSIAVAITDVGLRERVWPEHRDIWEAIRSGDTEAADAAARKHTTTAAAETCRRLSALAARSAEAASPIIVNQ